MKTFGLLASQTLISLPEDGDGNAITDSLKPHDAGDQWTSPTIVPLVKIDKPTEPDGQKAEPKLVWFEDRVERQWELVTAPPAPRPDAPAWKVKVWLIRNGISESQITGIIESNYEAGPARDEALIRWRDAPSVPFAHSMVSLIANALELNPGDVWDQILAV